MYNDMLVEKYLKIIKGQFTVPFVFDKKFYDSAMKYFKDKSFKSCWTKFIKCP